MGWARLDDGWHDHPKVIAAGLDAAGLWVMCLTWAHANRRSSPTPGYLPRSVLTRFAGSKASKLSKKLADVGLLDAADGGWIVHDFADYLPRYDSTKAADAGKAGAASRWGRGRAAATEHPPPDGEPPPDPHDEPLHEPPSKPDGGSLANRSRNHGSRASARRNPDPVPSSGQVDPPGSEPNAHENGGGVDPESADPLARLVADVHAARPDWTPAAIRSAALAAPDPQASLDDIRIALLDVAGRPDTTAPGRIRHPGPWWPTPPTPTPPPARERLRGTPELDPERNRRGRAAVDAALAARKPAEPEETP